MRQLGRPAALRAMILIPLVAMVVTVAMFVSMSPSRTSCVPADGLTGLVATQSHPKSCPAVYGYRGFGHGP